MIETPHITQPTTQLTAIIHLTVPRDEIQSVMGPGISEVYATVAAQGIAPAGPWFTHHLRRPNETFDFEICVPVATPVAPAGRVATGEWPAMKVARSVYCGDYAGLGEAWGEFLAWVEAEGLTTTGDLYERYLTGPETSPNPADWRTELNQPLMG